MEVAPRPRAYRIVGTIPIMGMKPVNVLHEQEFVLPDALEGEPGCAGARAPSGGSFAHAHDDRVEHGREHQEKKEGDEEYDKVKEQCVVHMHDRCRERYVLWWQRERFLRRSLRAAFVQSSPSVSARTWRTRVELRIQRVSGSPRLNWVPSAPFRVATQARKYHHHDHER